MITGVETAGLVLAIFPIVLKGLSQFREGLETMKDMQNFTKLLSEFEFALGTEKTLFDYTLQRLLVGSKIAKTEKKLCELLDNPHSDEWKAPENDEALRIFLDESYDIYMRCVTKLRDSIESLHRKLLVGPDPSGSTVGTASHLLRSAKANLQEGSMGQVISLEA